MLPSAPPPDRSSAANPVEVDVAIVGAGGAGLSLAVQLDRVAARRGHRAPSVALIDPVIHRGSDRTWYFWDTGRSDLEPAVTRSWSRVGVVDRAGRSQILDLSPLRYVMIGAADFYDLAEQSLRSLEAIRVPRSVLAVADGPHRTEVRTEAVTVRARWVFDSRPAPPRRPARTEWLQHFRGWTVLLDRPAFDPDEAVLMDFSVIQPGSLPGGGVAGPGLAFGYVLPTAPDRALVEYTVFSRRRLPGPAYDAALRAYLAARLPGVDPSAIAVEAVEDAAIPMTDAVHARRVGHRVLRLGTSGGATRGSTGYAFSAIQRQTRAVAERLIAGSARTETLPLPPRAYPSRHRWMDAVLLRALDRQMVDGPDLFIELFRRNPPARVLRFLDGMTSLSEDLAVMASTPASAMARAAVGDAAVRLRNRVADRPRRR